MRLVLVINGITIERENLDYTEMETEQERENYQNSLANELKVKHLDKIKMAGYKYNIYVDVLSSKVNEEIQNLKAD